jgi:exodeoxyribonuclease VII large subunit
MQERKLRLQSAARALQKPDDVLAIARQRFDGVAQRLPASLRANVQRHGLQLAKTAGRLSVAPMRNRVVEAKRRVPELSARANHALKQLLLRRQDKFNAEAKLLQSMSYKSVLARGYAVVRDGSGKTLQAAGSVKPGAALQIEFSDGQIDATASSKPGQGRLL